MYRPCADCRSCRNRLQSVVRAESAPSELAVLSVGSIRAGDASNIIPDFADIKLTIRTFLPHVHERVLAAVHRIVRAECDACKFKRLPSLDLWSLSLTSLVYLSWM